MNRIRKHWKGLLASAVVLVAVLAVGIPFLYIHLIEGDQPPPLSLSSASGSTSSSSAASSAAGSTAAADFDGTWAVGAGSLAGYRVKETLAGQGTTAVGRTSAVSGSVTFASAAATAGTFTVQMAKVTSDQSRRDSKFAGSIMETSKYPTGTFTLTQPVVLGSVPAVGATFSGSATGNLTLHGTTKLVTFKLTGNRTGSSVTVNGTIDIKYGDYNINNPSIGGFVSVGDSGTIEFLLALAKG